MLGLSRQALYKNAWNVKDKALQEHLVVSEVKQLRSEHPVMGTRKLHLLLQSFLHRHSIWYVTYLNKHQWRKYPTKSIYVSRDYARYAKQYLTKINLPVFLSSVTSFEIDQSTANWQTIYIYVLGV